MAGDLRDRTCLAFGETIVIRGQAKGVVIATGADTEIGRISGPLSSVDRLQTPLLMQMKLFARWLTLLILLIAGALVAISVFIRKDGSGRNFMSACRLPQSLKDCLLFSPLPRPWAWAPWLARMPLCGACRPSRP